MTPQEKVVVSMPMSELARRISLLKGNRTTQEIVTGADVSRETFRKIEKGQSVKLKTLIDIADFLKASAQQRTELIIAWIKLELGRYATDIQLQPKEGAALRESSKLAEEIQSIASQLEEFDQNQILMAMTRPEVRRSLPAINALYDTLKGKKR